MSHARKQYGYYIESLRKVAQRHNLPLSDVLRHLNKVPARLSDLMETPEQTENRLIELGRMKFYEWLIEEYRNGAISNIENIEKNAETMLREKLSKAGKYAADIRHSKPGASREKHKNIRATWASGKYTSRDICAEQEFEALGFGSHKAARNALIKTPDPDPWPAKKAKVK